MELLILTIILKWTTFVSYVIAFAMWNTNDKLNGFLKYMFLVGALSIMAGNDYPGYLMVINCIVFGLLGIIWHTRDNLNMFIKGYLIVLSLIHFYILVQ